MAAALKEKLELFESQGLEVPEFLAQQVAEAGDAGGQSIVQVEADEVTQDSWRLIAEDQEEAAAAAVDAPAADEVAVEAAEAEEVVADEVEVEVEAEAEVEADEAPKPRRRSAKKADSTEE